MTFYDDSAALEPDGIVHRVELHRSRQLDDVWAIGCGGYTVRVYKVNVAYVTCLLCAAGMDYWRGHSP